ncbi:hypothetical protein BRADI_4g09943v3 [Brachypodium distachyon]|uniref:Uncharacterized protein n=1 Tax=Brachypodium distachyon TaxID=15368 RepID=A0A2K2CLQ2_BRADI|nr:hypothetical protein BRADI_4g09943v3 [Brachypodium distachyon]
MISWQTCFRLRHQMVRHQVPAVIVVLVNATLWLAYMALQGLGRLTLQFARYIRDYIKYDMKGKNSFDVIWCIHASETFNVDDIFDEMFKDITQVEHSDSEDLPGKNKDSEDPPVKKKDSGKLKRKLKKALTGKCFLFILDDFWVENRNDEELLELVSPLNAGRKGSKILVTARTEKPCLALGDYHPTEMPDLDEEQYFEMFMHHALGGTDVSQEQFIPAGRDIAKKLHRSPIAAVTVGGRLGITPDVKSWERAARLDVLNNTRGALWWSYQHLDADIRRCFEYCIIFPRRYQLKMDELIDLWTAQGFVKTTASEDMTCAALSYLEVLLSCSVLKST